MLFMSIVLLFPTTPQTNAAGMNYSVVVIGGVILLALGWYYFPKYGGVHWFNGPIRNVEVAMEGVEAEDEKFTPSI